MRHRRYLAQIPKTGGSALGIALAVLFVSTAAGQQPNRPGPAPFNDFLYCCKIGNISVDQHSLQVSARNPKTAKTLVFAVPTAVTQDLHPGQNVWVDAFHKKAMVVTFPIDKSQPSDASVDDGGHWRGGRDNLGHSHYMQTIVKVSWPAGASAGRIDGRTRTWTSEAARGFEGTVVVFLLDDKRPNPNILYNTPMHQYGVNGEAVPGAASDRTELWMEPVSADILGRTRSVSIVHLDHGKDHWNDFISKAKDVLQIAKTAVEIYADTQTGGTAGSTGSTEPPATDSSSVVAESHQRTGPHAPVGGVRGNEQPPTEAGFGPVNGVKPKVNRVVPCCSITGFTPVDGVVAAREAATGRTFQFKVNDPALLKTLKVGQKIYANFATKKVSVDGIVPCCTFVPVDGFAPVDGVRGNEQPPAGTGYVPGDGVKPRVNPGIPCCAITGFTPVDGVVAARETATGRTFQFKVNDAALLKSLKVGQKIYANFATKKVSVDGLVPCCSMK